MSERKEKFSIKTENNVKLVREGGLETTYQVSGAQVLNASKAQEDKVEGRKNLSQLHFVMGS